MSTTTEGDKDGSTFLSTLGYSHLDYGEYIKLKLYKWGSKKSFCNMCVCVGGGMSPSSLEEIIPFAWTKMHWLFKKYVSQQRGTNILYMWMRLKNTYSVHLWKYPGREGAKLRGCALWYLRTQRLVVHFECWQGGNMLSGWRCKCREFACLCVALPQDRGRGERVFLTSRLHGTKMGLSRNA